MLIASKRHTPRDLEAWASTEDAARAWAATAVHRNRVAKTRAALLSFTGSGRCYAGTSWGKDSVVIAHLIVTMVPRVPIVWVRVEPDYNPDCLLVRDAFRSAFRPNYDEIEVKRGGSYRAHGTLVEGMRIATERYGDKYISGVRGDESGSRKMRMMTHGTSTDRTCAPIGWWTARDVFAYLTTNNLPVHPAYACTMDGLLSSEQIRVSPLGGDRGSRPGDGWGRKQWEERYYSDALYRAEL
jgi:phosphoadenosine phosphosulfate reductase